MNIRLRIEDNKKKLEDIQKAVEYYNQHRQRTLEQAEKVERMAFNGEIGPGEYDALMSAYTGGMPLNELEKRYGRAISHYKRLEEELKQETELLESMAPEEIEEREPRMPYVVFIASLLLASAVLFIGLGSTTGSAVYAGSTTGADYFLFIIAAGMIVAVFFLLFIIFRNNKETPK